MQLFQHPFDPFIAMKSQQNLFISGSYHCNKWANVNEGPAHTTTQTHNLTQATHLIYDIPSSSLTIFIQLM